MACYGGPRRTPDPLNDQDRAHYLRLQHASLSGLKHSLAQITFVSNGGRQDYLDYLHQLPYTVIERENVGMSYGAWADAWRIYRDAFDFYIWIEDDYIFVRDDFDAAMVDLFEYFSGLDPRAGCGYVCQLVKEPMHPAIMNGIISSTVLARVDVFPTLENYGQDANQNVGQMGWGPTIRRIKNGATGEPFRMWDMGHRFTAPFCEGDRSITWYYPDAPEALMIPAHLLNVASLEDYGTVQHQGQFLMGKRLAGLGLKVYDMGERFKAPFCEEDGSITWYYAKAPELLLVPAQIYEEVNDGESR